MVCPPLQDADAVPQGGENVPTKPKRPCRMTGCPNLAEDGEFYCSAHKKAANHEYNHYRRDPETKKRYGRAWKRIRDRHIREHPMCEECLERGIFKPAEEVHHKVPLSDGGTHDRNNLVSLCRSCHMKAHGQLGTRDRHSFED